MSRAVKRLQMVRDPRFFPPQLFMNLLLDVLASLIKKLTMFFIYFYMLTFTKISSAYLFLAFLIDWFQLAQQNSAINWLKSSFKLFFSFLSINTIGY